MVMLSPDLSEDRPAPETNKLAITFNREHCLERIPQLDVYHVDGLGFLGHSADLRTYTLNSDVFYFEQSDDGRLIVTPIYGRVQPALRVLTGGQGRVRRGVSGAVLELVDTKLLHGLTWIAALDTVYITPPIRFGGRAQGCREICSPSFLLGATHPYKTSMVRVPNPHPKRDTSAERSGILAFGIARAASRHLYGERKVPGSHRWGGTHRRSARRGASAERVSQATQPLRVLRRRRRDRSRGRRGAERGPPEDVHRAVRG